MENNKYTPKIVCNENREFNIPIYQRLFEWGADNINQLLDDLYNEFSKDPSNPYYVGMLTMYNEDLVDGQQRFTVLSIIATVFQKENLYPEWAKMEGKLKLKARPKDQEYLKMLFGDSVSLNYQNKKMLDGKKTVEKWVEGKTDMATFAKYVFEKCTFFVAKLPENYQAHDLNKYFEAMNSTGRNLESHEIIKVEKFLKNISEEHRVFYNAVWNLVSDMDKPLIRLRTENGRKETEEELRNRYKNAIKYFDENIKACRLPDLNDFKADTDNDEEFKSIRDLVADGHNPDVRRQDKYYGEGFHSALNFSEFLLQLLYIVSNLEDDDNVNVNEFFDIHHLIETFNKYTECWGCDDWEFLGQELLRYRIIYDYYILRIPNSDYNPYDLEFSEKDSESDVKVDSSVIKQFQSMLYVDSSSKTYYRWIVPFLKFLKDNYEPSASDIFKKLKEIDNDIKDHSISILDDPSNYNFGGRHAVYLLRRLDFYLWLDNHKKNSQEIDSVIN